MQQSWQKNQSTVIAATTAFALLAIFAGALIGYTGLLSIALFIAGMCSVAALIAMTRNPFYGLLLITFFLPFERVGSFSLAGSTVRISQILALVTGFFWVCIGFAKGSLRIKKNVLSLPLSLFVITLFLSLLDAQNLTRGIQVLAFSLFVMVFSFLVPNLVTTKKHIETVIKVLFLCSALVGLFGLFQFVGDAIGLPSTMTLLRPQYTKAVFGFPRIQSTALEPLYFANFLLIPIALAFSLFLQKHYIIRKSWLVGLLALLLLNIALTLSRGGYAGLLGTLIVIGIYFFKKTLTPLNLMILGAIAGAVLVGASFFIQLSGFSKALDIFTTQATNYREGAGIEERYSTYELAYRAFFASSSDWHWYWKFWSICFVATVCDAGNRLGDCEQ